MSRKEAEQAKKENSLSNWSKLIVKPIGEAFKKEDEKGAKQNG